MSQDMHKGAGSPQRPIVGPQRASLPRVRHGAGDDQPTREPMSARHRVRRLKAKR